MEDSYFFVLILGCSLGFLQSFESNENVFELLAKNKIQRVDIGVKRPVRFCQGFEDPTEIDCYMRSEVKSYVCTEPVTFNPCESLERVETYHYDHILHKCVKVNVPACEGQLIRVMTLLQCLVYCHNKDPFALGKSRSMVYKLNQPKPYIPPEKNEEEKEKVTVNIDQNRDDAKKNQISETVSKDSKTLDLVNKNSDSGSSNSNGSPNKKVINNDETFEVDFINMENVLIKQSFTIIPRTEVNKIRTSKMPIQINGGQHKVDEIIVQDIKENSETATKEINKKNDKKLNDKNEMKEKTFSKIKPNEVHINSLKKKMGDMTAKIDNQISENVAKRSISIINNIALKNKKKVEIKKEKKSKLDESLKTDSKDKSTDYGFYLWDE